MITEDRLRELLHQAATIAQNIETVSDQFTSYGVEPDAAMRFLEAIKESIEDEGWPIEPGLSLAFIAGILIGRDQ